MYRETMRGDGGVPIVLMDSMSQVEAGDRGAVVVAGSNGGQESGRVAAAARCGFVLLNDAGVGKDAAGIAALAILQDASIPAATVSHESAEISDGRDMWDSGIVSHVNDAAAALQVATGAAVAPILRRIAQQLHSCDEHADVSA